MTVARTGVKASLAGLGAGPAVGKFSKAVLGLLPFGFLLLMLVAPLLRLLWEGWVNASGERISTLWRDSYLHWRILWSVLQAALTCVSCYAPAPAASPEPIPRTCPA